MQQNRRSRNEQKEERKEARAAFRVLLRRLRGKCDTLDELSEWEELLREVDALLTEYQEVIPAGREQRVRDAMDLGEATVAGMQEACRVLRIEVERLVRYLGVAPALGTVATGALVVVAAGVVVVAVLSFIRAVDIAVYNHGCGTIPVGEMIEAPLSVDSGLLDVLGVDVPDAIPEGEPPTVISVPPVVMAIEYQPERSALMLEAVGRRQAFPIPPATAIEFDGQSVLESRREFDLRAGSEHELRIRCAA